MRMPLLTSARAHRRPPATVSAPHYLESLLSQREGYADVATVTGGAGSPAVRVTNLNASGAGSLAAALASSAYITFTPGMVGNITPAGVLLIPANTTIDGRGANISIDPGLRFAGPNSIVTNIKLTGVLTSNSGSDCLNTVDDTVGGFDGLWVHRVTASDSRDGLCDFSGWESTLCRATISECYFGPNPGPAGVARGQTQAKGSLLGNSDVWTQGFFTFARCYWEGVQQRNPFPKCARAHVYGSAVVKWGDQDTGGFGMCCGNVNPDFEAELRVEGTVFRPYKPGETHLGFGTPVNHPCLQAIMIDAATTRADWLPKRRVYENNNSFMYGAQAGYRSFWPVGGSGPYDTGRTSPITGLTYSKIDPEVDFKDAVFTPPYAYTAPKPTDDESFIRTLRASAGWHDVPPPF